MRLRVIADVGKEDASRFFNEKQPGAPGKSTKVSNVGKMADEQSVVWRSRQMVPQFLLPREEVHFAEFNRVAGGRWRGTCYRMLFQLLQLRVLSLSFFQDGRAGIGIFPQSEEVFVSRQGSYSCGIGICALRSSRLHSIRPRHAQMR
jgi:hypothetical protein